ncbi:MAG: YbdK family carboxylate-amine ligase [Halobacteria archaeon]
MSDSFQDLGTLGVEEEFYIVDPGTLMPVEASEELLENPPSKLEPWISGELFSFMMETKTDKAYSLDEIYDEIAEKRRLLKDHAEEHGYELLATGMHPTVEWSEYEPKSKPRYLDQIDRLQYAERRNIVTGLHVHVGMDDPDKAVWVCNEMRRYIPLIRALGANSPFWKGSETGLASARTVIYENQPNTGTPTDFGSFEEFEEFKRRIVDEGVAGDEGELWWDVRPNSRCGTVEVRAPDPQASLERTFDLTALIYHLSMMLGEKYESGSGFPEIRKEYLDNNNWAAIRYGMDAEFLRLDADEGTVSVEKMLKETLSEADMEEDEREALIERLLDGTGAMSQIELHEEEGFESVLEGLKL